MCRCVTVLYKGLNHPCILISVGSQNQSPSDTEDRPARTWGHCQEGKQLHRKVGQTGSSQPQKRDPERSQQVENQIQMGTDVSSDQRDEQGTDAREGKERMQSISAGQRGSSNVIPDWGKGQHWLQTSLDEKSARTEHSVSASHLLMTSADRNMRAICHGHGKEFWAKRRTIARKAASRMTLADGCPEACFSAPFYVFSEQRTSSESGVHSFKVSSKNRPARTRWVRTALAPGKAALSPKERRRGHPREGSVCLYL